MLLLERRPGLAGACLGALAFKPQLAVGVPLALVLAGRWRALLTCAAVAVALPLLSWLVLGTVAWRGFFAAMPFIGSILHDPGIWPKLVSVFAGVRLGGGSPSVAAAAQGLCALAGLACVAWVAWRRPGAGAEMATLVAAAMLCTPYLMDYDLVCLAIPMAWVASRGAHGGWLNWEKIVLAACFIAPLGARGSNLVLGLSVMPPLLLALLWVIIHRVWCDARAPASYSRTCTTASPSA